jgi:hypothetical protein
MQLATNTRGWEPISRKITFRRQKLTAESSISNWRTSNPEGSSTGARDDSAEPVCSLWRSGRPSGCGAERRVSCLGPAPEVQQFAHVTIMLPSARYINATLARWDAIDWQLPSAQARSSLDALDPLVIYFLAIYLQIRAVQKLVWGDEDNDVHFHFYVRTSHLQGSPRPWGVAREWSSANEDILTPYSSPPQVRNVMKNLLTLLKPNLLSIEYRQVV